MPLPGRTVPAILGGATALALIGTAIAAPLSARAVSDSLLINEVYARGGSANQPYTTKYVELYNPTNAAISLDGWSLQYRKSTGTGPASAAFTLKEGTVEPGGFFVLAGGSNGQVGAPLPKVDLTSTFAPSGSEGTVYLVHGTAAVAPDDASVVDRVGYGASNAPEGTAVDYPGGNSKAGSIGRNSTTDTDDNAKDFTFSEQPTPGAANPGQTGGPTPAPSTPAPTDAPSTPAPTDAPSTPAPTDAPSTPAPSTDPAAETPIADIQGKGALTSPLNGNQVTTRGVVTASYRTGGFNGYYIQTPGTGGTAKTAADASDGLFVFLPADKVAGAPAVGECVVVQGKVTEYGGTTPAQKLTELNESSRTKGEGCAPVKATDLDTLPASDADREAYEGMLVLPKGNYTITNNYALNTFGQLGLAQGDKALRTATDVALPGSAADAVEAENQKKYITLDDGSSWDYLKNKTAQNSPLPYLSQDTPMRTNSKVTFAQPVILDYRFQWNFQPTGQVVGPEQSFLKSQNDRPATPPKVAGDVKVATFNVLNYFTDLGKDQSGCKAYNDREGNPVGANGCKVRGAYSQQAFDHQQAKIVNAINTMDADVVGLMEIETASQFGHDRDATLKHLVDELNKADASKGWNFVPSNMGQVPSTEDVIRVAFIYRTAKVKPVDSSQILSDPAFSNARQPLAQKFGVVNGQAEFVVVANHFKSKGSGPDDGTGQGNSNPARKDQAKALTTWVNSTFKDVPTLLIGDFNAYSKEDPVRIIEEAGFKNVESDEQMTYQFDGRLGSLDHVFANPAAQAMFAGSAVWDINADESIAMQYSRENYNATNFYAPTPFAASDHDPAIVGLKVKGADPEPVEHKVTSTSVGTKQVNQHTYVWGSVSNVPAGTPVMTQALVNGKWSTSRTGTIDANGNYTLELTYGASTPGSYQFRVVSLVDGVEVAGTPFTLVRTAVPATVSASHVTTKKIGQPTFVWGVIGNAPANTPVMTQALVNGKWSTSRTGTTDAKGGYTLELTYGATTPGTYQFRVVALVNGTWVSGQPFTLTRVR